MAGPSSDPPEAANYTGLKKIFNADTFRGRANVSPNYIIFFLRIVKPV